MPFDFSQQEAILSHLAKANPPAKLYRYRGESDYALNEIREPHLHIASPADMNDPFEYRAPLNYDLSKLRQLAVPFFTNKQGMDKAVALTQANAIDSNLIDYLSRGIDALRDTSGLICLCSTPRSNRMWAYYGVNHRGICITYDTCISPFAFARSVTYEDPETPLDAVDAHLADPMRFGDHVSFRKGEEWRFEQEFRISVGPFKEGQTRILPIQPEAILEIRLGVKIRDPFKANVLAAAETLRHRPKIIQMECDFQSFEFVEQVIQ
jgi:hypothetical protein